STSRSSAFASAMRGIGFLGTTRTWVGAAGRISWSAITWSSSYTIVEGISRAAIFSKSVLPKCRLLTFHHQGTRTAVELHRQARTQVFNNLIVQLLTLR